MDANEQGMPSSAMAASAGSFLSLSLPALPLFAAALEGYATHARAFITAEEQAAMVDGVLAIYLELAARFAADALNEAYFGWSPVRFASRGDHNLARARNQLAAARDLARQRAAAGALVAGQFSRAALAG